MAEIGVHRSTCLRCDFVFQLENAFQRLAISQSVRFCCLDDIGRFSFTIHRYMYYVIDGIKHVIETLHFVVSGGLQVFLSRIYNMASLKLETFSNRKYCNFNCSFISFLTIMMSEIIDLCVFNERLFSTFISLNLLPVLFFLIQFYKLVRIGQSNY